ncbi:hypothetical protein COY23_04530 [bacterium (Candidatus Torokbacteria) CG_4_10_14_0_2_um_filter_35_8]|nr:MAG: hypothetical protein COY23_04530 [bacterium (Candidatus Torokbacteria) CG_4_10_14_0_2_um_filter_35_8]
MEKQESEFFETETNPMDASRESKIREIKEGKLTEQTKFQIKTIEKIQTMLDKEGVDIWIGGGFAVDALAKGRVTREHDDIDGWVLEKDISKVEEMLSKEGYKITKEGSKLSVKAPEGIFLDLHPLKEKSATELEEQVVGDEASIIYPKEDFSREPVPLEDIQIRTISPKTLYELAKHEEQREKGEYHAKLLEEIVKREERNNEAKERLLSSLKSIYSAAQALKEDKTKNALETELIDLIKGQSEIREYLKGKEEAIAKDVLKSSSEDEFVSKIGRFKDIVEQKLKQKID